MQPVSMEQHCSSCHLLTFDPDHPDRELPGEPDELLLMMEVLCPKDADWRDPCGRTPRV